MLDFTESFRIRNLPLTWLPPARRRALARLEPYIARLGRLYAAIQEVAGGGVIVDSSKNPSYGYLLRYVDGVDPYYLHLVRDAPPVAYSWGKQKDFEPGVPMARKDPIASGAQWLARNVTAELFLPRGTTRWRQLRYEDFVTAPSDHVEALMSWLDAPTGALPFTSSHDFRIDRPAHSVFGNATRFRRGTVTVRPDERWRQEMPRSDQLKVAGLTWPLRLRYRYVGRRSPARDLAERQPA
jgi:hypothetical protein